MTLISSTGNKEKVSYQLDSLTFPVNPKSGDQMFVTNTGDYLGDTSEQWIFDGTNWFEIKQTDVIEGTWTQLEAIRSANELNVNKTYILTDYKHKYVIEGSDSQPTAINTNVIGQTGGYAQLSPSATHLSVGNIVTITAVPSGYVGPITVGSTTTITTVFNSGYMIFSPNINQTGFSFVFNAQRYSNVINNTTINDINGKPIIKPGGVINTDVHDGTPYADMSALENFAVPTEKIKLKALDINKFSLDAESATFIGDRLRYDFLDVNVKDINGNTISSRNGFILGRYNDELDVGTNKDWRVQRYRRYLVDDTSFNLYNYVGNPLYQVGGIDACGISKPIITEDKYFLNEPEVLRYYVDVTTATTPDPFLTGNTSIYNNSVVTDLTKNITIQSFDGKCKDYPIIPLTQTLTKNSLVNKYKVNDTINSICLLRGQAFGISAPITISLDGRLGNTTIHTGISMTGSTGTIDNSQIWNNITVYQSQFNWNTVHHKVNGVLKSNARSVEYVTFGARNSNPFHTMYLDDTSLLHGCVFGGNNRTEIKISNAVLNRFYFIPLQVPNTPNGGLTITGNAYLTHISGATRAGNRLYIDNSNTPNNYKEELRTGTVSISLGTTSVIGTGTLFTTELAVGNVIIIGGIEFTIQSITNNTSLIVTAPHTSTLTNQTFNRRFSRYGYKYNAQQTRASHVDVNEISDNNVRKYLYNEQYDANRQRSPFLIAKPL